MANQTASIPVLDPGQGPLGGTPNALGGRAGPAPLGPVLVFVGLNSLGTGAVQTGVFFLLRSAYGFAARDNFLFGLFLYGAYIAGALAVGPVMRRGARPAGGLGTGPGSQRGFSRGSTRRVLGTLVMVQAMIGLVPQIVAWTTGVRTPPVWTVWLVGIGFGVLTGMMWPIAESFLSGGRTGRALSRATGKFNIVWAVAVVAAFWLMAPLLEDRPIAVITLLAFVQAGSVCCLAWFPAEPAKHLETRHEPHPASWRRLLTWFRVLLPMGYVLCGAISPLLPGVVDRVGVAGGWAALVASAWVTSRVFVFAIFERWDGWHGRFWMPWVAGGGLVGGFAATVAMPPSAGVWALIAALAVFGVGHATAYVGALYYAMELGDAEVAAGGTHEALIGAGYAAGPVLGLIAYFWAGADHGAAFDSRMLGLVGVVVLAVLVAAMVLLATSRR